MCADDADLMCLEFLTEVRFLRASSSRFTFADSLVFWGSQHEHAAIRFLEEELHDETRAHSGAHLVEYLESSPAELQLRRQRMGADHGWE
jgi:hypothetical protein